MRTILVAVLLVGAALFAGCGQSPHWFPGKSSGNNTVSPRPSNDSAIDVQADTVIDSTYFKTLPYQVRFNNQTTHSLSASISISGDLSSQYSIDDGTTWKGTSDLPQAVIGGSNVYVRHTSSNQGPNQTITSTLFVGGYSATYTSKTGSLIFVTKTASAGSTTPVQSDTVTVPQIPPNGFTYGSPSTIIAFTADSDPSSKMYIDGTFMPSPSTITAGQRIYFTNTAGTTSGTIVTTKVLLTGSNNTTYTVTFKSKAI